MKKIRTRRNGSFSPLARIKFRLIDKSKRLGRELERAGKEGTSGTYRQYFVPYDIQAESYFSMLPSWIQRFFCA